MARKYRTGSRAEVLRNMAMYAIRDQEALMDAMRAPYEDPDDETIKAIADAKDCIIDFRRLAKTMSAL